jgi:hypothetical protein
MTPDEIIEMARQAGFAERDAMFRSVYLANIKDLEAFAKLVAEKEREACANLCEQHGYEHYCGNVTDKLAETIRARGQA